MRVDIPPGMKPGQNLRVMTPAGMVSAIIPKGSEAFGYFVMEIPPHTIPNRTNAS